MEIFLPFLIFFVTENSFQKPYLFIYFYYIFLQFVGLIRLFGRPECFITGKNEAGQIWRTNGKYLLRSNNFHFIFSEPVMQSLIFIFAFGFLNALNLLILVHFWIFNDKFTAEQNDKNQLVLLDTFDSNQKISLFS
jgi:hypothetical protein